MLALQSPDEAEIVCEKNFKVGDCLNKTVM